jgi:signal transduction histidine kinase
MLVVLTILITSNILTQKFTDSFIERMVKDDLVQWGKDFEAMVEPNFRDDNYLLLESQVEDALRNKPGDFIILFDHDKNELLRGGVSFQPSQIGLSSRLFTEKVELSGQAYYVMASAVKDKHSDTTRGYMLYGHSLKEEQKVTATLRNYIIYTSILLFVLAAVLLRFIIKKIIAPLHTIKKGLEMVGHGNMSYRIHIKTNDEFAFLANKFDEMAEQLEYMMTELETTQKDLENQVYRRTEALDTANTKLKEAMAELKYTQKRIIQTETQKSLTSIVSGFAHEINNPLTGILGYIDLMELNNDLSPYSRRRLEGIKGQALRIKDIIDDLNQMDPEIEQTKREINLTNLLEKLIKIIGKENADTGIRFETDFMDGEMIVYGNHFALWQVLEGIVENAIEAIRERDVKEGKILVTLKKSPDATGAVIDILDNGGGFENIDKAFNPFYTTKNRTQKRGIGLAIAFNLVREHKGKISIHNQEEPQGEKGAKVSVHLPLHSHPHTNTATDPEYHFQQQ